MVDLVLKCDILSKTILVETIEAMVLPILARAYIPRLKTDIDMPPIPHVCIFWWVLVCIFILWTFHMRSMRIGFPRNNENWFYSHRMIFFNGCKAMKDLLLHPHLRELSSFFKSVCLSPQLSLIVSASPALLSLCTLHFSLNVPASCHAIAPRPGAWVPKLRLQVHRNRKPPTSSCGSLTRGIQ